MRSRLPLALLGLAALLVSACSSGASSTPAGGSSAIAAELSEWAIRLDPVTGKAGPVTFTIRNAGEKEHEFLIIKTDMRADSLPVKDDELDVAAFGPMNMDMGSTAPGQSLGMGGMEHPAGTVGQAEGIAAGENRTLTVELEAGHYVIVCNLTAHYSKGMRADFDVAA